jgi:hypothetical protein
MSPSVMTFAVLMAAAPPPAPLDVAAEGYVKLVLALGRHDADYVDAFYGPALWREQADKTQRPLPDIRAEARSLIARIETIPPAAGDELAALRREYLRRQLQALVSRVDILEGAKLRFDEESKALYDVVVPPLPDRGFVKTLAELEALLPGDAPLPDRYEAYRKRFYIPAEKVAAVFTAAIDECRRRTLRHIELPADESFTVEYVTGKSWSAYNWYKGGARSVIQVNTDLPIGVGRALDLACHEGYPGHHVYNALLEDHLVKRRGWVEFSVYPLFSPQSLIAEGTASFALEVAFPGKERIAFERDTLFPLAGLDPKEAEHHWKVQDIVTQLGYAKVEAARRYVDGAADAERTAAYLQSHGLLSAERAKQQIRFFDQYRSYIINYDYGRDLVRRYVEARGGTADQPDRRWQELEKLLASPRLPSGLAP